MKNFNLSLLYAEDDLQTRENYYEFFRVFFQEVTLAKDGEEAYEKYIEKHPDIVVFDIKMPKLDGLSLSKKIREDNKDIPIVIFSAHPNTTNLLNAIDTNITKFLVKPVKTFELQKIFIELNETLSLRYQKIVKLKYGIIWDLEEKSLYNGTQEVKLSKLEREFLILLSSQPKNIFTNEDIINYLWPDNFQKEYDTKVLRALVYRLKTKLGVQVIESIYKIGYKLDLA